jgi:hypothetical protein
VLTEGARKVYRGRLGARGRRVGQGWSSDLRLSLCKEPYRRSVSLPSPEDGNGCIFRNAVFSSYLEFRKVDSPETQWFWILPGGLQISIPGPSLFLIYANDIPDILDVKLSLVADDIALLNRDNPPSPPYDSSCWNFSAPRHFQSSGLWNAASNNPDETTAILFNRRSHGRPPESRLINHSVPQSRKLKCHPLSTVSILDIIHRPVFHFKHDVSETGSLCLWRLALSSGPNWVSSTWRWRQNPVSEMSCYK